MGLIEMVRRVSRECICRMYDHVLDLLSLHFVDLLGWLLVASDSVLFDMALISV